MYYNDKTFFYNRTLGVDIYQLSAFASYAESPGFESHCGREVSVPVNTVSKLDLSPVNFQNRKSLVMKLIQCTYKFK